MHYLESVTQILCMEIFCGMYLPITTATIGGFYLLGRILFSYGYKKTGPNGRKIGAPIVMLIQMFMPIYTMVCMGMWAGQADKQTEWVKWHVLKILLFK